MHVPAWQTSVCVHALPSLHALPSDVADQADVLLAGSHVWQLFAGFAAPAETHAPPITQVPAWSGCAHAPDWQISEVHAIESLEHDVPSLLLLAEQPPAPSHVDDVWHSFAAHVYAAPPHVPLVQTSLLVHALESLQDVPFAAIGFEHLPVAPSHVPAAWHWSVAEHVIARPPHVPAVQTSLVVQSEPSLQGFPSGMAGLEQTPDVGSHVPAAWHWSAAAQVIVLAPVQVPLWHVSVCVQALPSLHVVPFGSAGLEHCPVVVLHVPPEWH